MKESDDTYWEGLFKICSMYRENKEVIRGMIGKFKVVSMILATMYCYLVDRGEIDAIDDVDEITRAKYLLEIL